MKMVIITMVAKLPVAKHSNNNNNIPVTLKYQVGFGQGIVMSHG